MLFVLIFLLFGFLYVYVILLTFLQSAHVCFLQFNNQTVLIKILMLVKYLSQRDCNQRELLTGLNLSQSVNGKGHFYIVFLRTVDSTLCFSSLTCLKNISSGLRLRRNIVSKQLLKYSFWGLLYRNTNIEDLLVL